ncbi:MAG: hypothetical protein NXY59_09505 [Aigarchaeota archaeon]|nr:hypothetical protein [Candidatus Pelearchaeum maunauluense]
MARKILSKTEVPIAVVERILAEHETALNPLQMRTLSYVRKYSRLRADQAELLIKKLMDPSSYGLTRGEAVQVADSCPTSVEELRAILSGYKRLVSFLLFSEEKMQGIVSLVKQALDGELKE